MNPSPRLVDLQNTERNLSRKKTLEYEMMWCSVFLSKPLPSFKRQAAGREECLGQTLDKVSAQIFSDQTKVTAGAVKRAAGA